jgi:hypothetical protein
MSPARESKGEREWEREGAGREGSEGTASEIREKWKGPHTFSAPISFLDKRMATHIQCPNKLSRQEVQLIRKTRDALV